MFFTVLLQIHSGNCLQKIGMLELSLIKLLHNYQWCNFLCLTVYIYSYDVPWYLQTDTHRLVLCE